jgi:hypothetical protein
MNASWFSLLSVTLNARTAPLANSVRPARHVGADAAPAAVIEPPARPAQRVAETRKAANTGRRRRSE